MITQVLNPTRDLLDILVAVAEILGAIATAGALWIMLKTLLEMKRQTDLASNPYLKLRFRRLKSISHDEAIGCPMLKDHYDSEPHERWRRIITNNLEQDLSDLKDQYLALELSNAGKSEVTKVAFQLTLEVSMFDNNILGLDIGPTRYSWSKDLTVELAERGSVFLPVSNVRYFPIYVCRISDLSYKDIRRNQYRDFDGPDETARIENELLRPRQPVQELEPETYIEETTPEVDDLEEEVPF